jgi:CheY-like chemotaxis protein
MLRLINHDSEQYFIEHLKALQNEKDKDWMRLSITFKRDDLFRQMTGSPLTAKRRITQINETHLAIWSTLQQKLQEHAQASLYLFGNKDVMLLIQTNMDDPSYAWLQNYIGHLHTEHEDLLQTRLIPLNTADVAVIENLSSYQLSLQEWQMFETLSDTLKRRTISRLRDLREKPVVLVVEDDQYVAYQIESFLKDIAGVIFVKTAEEAVKAYIDMAPECVLLDIHLPGRNGFDALHCIKKIDSEANVVVLTGDKVGRHVERAHEMGAMSFMEKPLARDYLVSVVQSMPLYRKAQASARR